MFPQLSTPILASESPKYCSRNSEEPEDKRRKEASDYSYQDLIDHRFPIPAWMM